MEILPATSAHYPGIAELINSLYPEQKVSAADIADGDRQLDPKLKFRRWVAVEKEQVIGAATYRQSVWFAHPQKFIIAVSVLPERQGGGLGSRLYDTVMEALQPFDPIALRANASGDRPQSIRFMEKRGFREVIRDVRLELNVQAFDLSRFTVLEDHFLENGIEIKTLPELETDPERNQKLYDLDWELSMSVPGDLAAGIGRRGLEKYIEYAISGPSVVPEGFFIAVRGDEYIGLSHLLVTEAGVSLYQGLTGVKPQYRHQGIGLAMKIRAIAYAQSHGYASIRTENDAKNIPMLSMNENLGYIRKSEWVTFEKQLQPMEKQPGSLP